MKIILARIMAEPIAMPGFPQLIVTRGFVYQFLKSAGWNPSERGFGSMDYAVFGPKIAREPLTDATERDHYLSQIADDYRREVVYA